MSRVPRQDEVRPGLQRLSRGHRPRPRKLRTCPHHSEALRPFTKHGQSCRPSTSGLRGKVSTAGFRKQMLQDEPLNGHRWPQAGAAACAPSPRAPDPQLNEGQVDKTFAGVPQGVTTGTAAPPCKGHRQRPQKAVLSGANMRLVSFLLLLCDLWS